jgi:hypothetical protein
MRQQEHFHDITRNGEVTADSGVWSWWDDGADTYEAGFYSCVVWQQPDGTETESDDFGPYPTRSAAIEAANSLAEAIGEDL